MRDATNIYQELAQRRREMARFRKIFWSVVAVVGLVGGIASTLIFLLTGIGPAAASGLTLAQFTRLLLIALVSLCFLLVGLWQTLRTPPPPEPPEGPPVLGALALAYVLPQAALGLPSLSAVLIYGFTSFAPLGRGIAWFYRDLPEMTGGWMPLLATLQSIGLAVVVYRFLLSPGVCNLERLGLRPVRLREVALGVAAGLGLWLAAAAIERATSAVAPAFLGGWTLLRADNRAGEMLILAAGILVAPMAEEIFFRGYVLPKWSAARGPLFAAIASSALFAALHLDPVAYPAIFAVGLALAWLTWRTRSLAPAVVAHAAFNLISLTLMLGS